MGGGPTLLHLHSELTTQSVTNGVMWTSIHGSPILGRYQTACRQRSLLPVIGHACGLGTTPAAATWAAIPRGGGERHLVITRGYRLVASASRCYIRHASLARSLPPLTSPDSPPMFPRDDPSRSALVLSLLVFFLLCDAPSLLLPILLLLLLRKLKSPKWRRFPPGRSLEACSRSDTSCRACRLQFQSGRPAQREAGAKVLFLFVFFFDIISRDPAVSKSNQLHDDILQFFL